MPAKTVRKTNDKNNEFVKIFLEKSHRDIPITMMDSRKNITERAFNGIGAKIPLIKLFHIVNCILQKSYLV